MIASLRFMLLASLLVAACGAPPDFTGTYNGSTTLTGNCSDTSSFPVRDSNTARWTVVQKDNVVTLSPSGTCGDFKADPTGDGSTADFRKKSCPKSTDGTATFEVTFTTGSFTLKGDALSGKINFEVKVTGTTYQSCNGNVTVAFIRSKIE